MRATVRLAARRGWAETTVEDIAAAAGVSPRTFFRYFPSKVDALFGDEPERESAIERALAERKPGESVLAAVRRGVIDFVTEFMGEPELYITRARLALEHPDLLGPALVRFARFEAIVAAAAAEELRASPSDLRPRLTGAAAAAAIRCTSQTWVARGGRGDPREIVHESFDLIERGLGSPLDGVPPPHQSPRS
jgi:TetR/AcrR family transcriptional regulator, regulator of mycofactocin system